jgi:hypothetical protein
VWAGVVFDTDQRGVPERGDAGGQDVVVSCREGCLGGGFEGQ